jgi:DNA-binding XRE family transcriptional regulator
MRAAGSPSIRFGLECLGRALFDARRRAGYTQAQLGHIAGLHQTTISRVERGKLNGMKLMTLASLIAGLGGIALEPWVERHRYID